jgi:uncharacterized protein YbjT (DUF2867 family)
VTTGAGLTAALDGVDALIDTTNIETMKASKAETWNTTATTTMVTAEAAAGVRHHVVLSIVNSDRVDYGYYLGKRAQESAALAGDVPVTILRSTQFHEFPLVLITRTKGPVVPVPKMRSQTVAASDVAQELVRLAQGEPVGRALDIAGPDVHEMPDLARRLLAHRGSSRRVVTVPIPGGVGRAMAGGGLLPLGEHTRATLTFEQWLTGNAQV